MFWRDAHSKCSYFVHQQHGSLLPGRGVAESLLQQSCRVVGRGLLTSQLLQRQDRSVSEHSTPWWLKKRFHNQHRGILSLGWVNINLIFPINASR